MIRRPSLAAFCSAIFLLLAAPVGGQEVAVGQIVYITAWNTELKNGAATVAAVPQDTFFKVERVAGDQLLITVGDGKGGTKQGWVRRAQVFPVSATEAQVKEFLKEHKEFRTTANAALQAGKFTEAADLYQQGRALSEKTLGARHPYTGWYWYSLANTYAKLNRGAEAESAYQAAYTVFRETQGDHPDTATVLNDWGWLRFNAKKPGDAERFWRLALAVRETTLGKDHLHVALSLANLAEALQVLERFEEAEPLSRRGLQIREAKLAGDDLQIAMSLNQLGSILYRLERFDEARPLFARSLAIREPKLGADHDLTTLVMLNVVSNDRALGKFAEAEPLIRRCLALRENKYGVDHGMAASPSRELAFVYYDQARYVEADPWFRRVLEIRKTKSGADHPDTAAALYDLAYNTHRLGRHADAEALFQSSLKIREAKLGPDHPDVALSLNGLAVCCRHLGRIAEGEPYLRRVLEIREAKYGKDHSYVASALANFALCFHPMGRFEELEPLLQRSVAIFEAKLGKDSLRLAAPLHALGQTYHSLGRYADAEKYYARSLAIRKQHQGEDHPERLMTLSLLGHLYQDTKRYAEAETVLKRSVELQEQRLGPDHSLTLHNVRLLALLQHAVGRNEEARKLYERCLRFRQTNKGAEPSQVAFALSNCGMIEAALDRPEEALRLYDQARRLTQRYVSRTLPSLTAEQQRAYLMRQSGSHEEAAGHCEDNLRDALSMAVRFAPTNAAVREASAGWLANGKGLQQEALAVAAQLQGVDDPQLRPLAEDLRKTRAAITLLKQQPVDAKDEAQRDNELQKLEQTARELTTRLQQRGGRAGEERGWVELPVIRAGIPENGVLIDLVRFRVWDFTARTLSPNRYFAWVVPKIGDARVIELGDAEAIDALVAELRKQIGNSFAVIREQGEAQAEKTLRKASRALAAKTIDPLLTLPEVKAAERWMLSPDGGLWLAPWAALPLGDADDAPYLVEKVRLQWLTSARELAPRPKSAAIGERSPPLLVADPDFGLSRDQADRLARQAVKTGLRGAQTRSLPSEGLALREIQRLEKTAVEAALITPHVRELCGRDPRALLGQNALEAVVKSIARPELMVLSTHGYFLPKQEVKSVALGGSEDAAATTAGGKAFEDPLLRCGLLLAGCQDQPQAGATRPGEDGVLTGLEVAALDLRGCQLVVLSACETGVGEVRGGEGVAGLRQAFQTAGAESVVATLWPIPDTESVRVINDFFTGLAAKESKSDALQKAQRRFIDQRRAKNAAAHPLYWAAWTVTGN